MPLSYHHVGRLQTAIVVGILLPTISTQTIPGLISTPPHISAPYTSSPPLISPAAPLQQAIQTFGLASPTYQTLLFSLLEPALSAISQATALSNATINNADVAETSLANSSLSINGNRTTEGLVYEPPRDQPSSDSSDDEDYLSLALLDVYRTSKSTDFSMAPILSVSHHQYLRSSRARVFPSRGKRPPSWSRRQIFIGCLYSLHMITKPRESRLDRSTFPSCLSAFTIPLFAKTSESSVPTGRFVTSYVSIMNTVTLGPNTTEVSNSSSEAYPTSTSSIVGNSTISSASITSASNTLFKVHADAPTATSSTLHRGGLYAEVLTPESDWLEYHPVVEICGAIKKLSSIMDHGLLRGIGNMHWGVHYRPYRYLKVMDLCSNISPSDSRDRE